MSLATFQTGTGTAAAARSDIAAELRRWIYQDEDERKRELLETNEAKRQAAAQRAMREALAEQQESIDRFDPAGSLIQYNRSYIFVPIVRFSLLPPRVEPPGF